MPCAVGGKVYTSRVPDSGRNTGLRFRARYLLMLRFEGLDACCRKLLWVNSR
jgi:hypothetical protein